MKEFEKFWNDPTNVELNELSNGPPNAKGFARVAWKDALKWVLEMIQYSNSDGSIIDYIKKELEK